MDEMILSDRVLGSLTDPVIPGACRDIRHSVDRMVMRTCVYVQELVQSFNVLTVWQNSKQLRNSEREDGNIEAERLSRAMRTRSARVPAGLRYLTRDDCDRRISHMRCLDSRSVSVSDSPSFAELRRASQSFAELRRASGCRTELASAPSSR